MQNVSRSGSAPARADVSAHAGYTARRDAKPADFLSVLDAANTPPADPTPVQANPSLLHGGTHPAIAKAATGKNLPGALPDSGKTFAPKPSKGMIGGLTAEQAGATTHPVSGDDSDPEAAIEPAMTGEVAAPAAVTALLGLTPPLAAQPIELADTGASSITPRAALPTLPETRATGPQAALVQAATKAVSLQAAPVAETNTAPAAPSAGEAVADQVAAIRLAPVEVIAPKSVATEAALRAMPQAAMEIKPAIQPAPAALTQANASSDNAPASTPMPQTPATTKADPASDAPAAPAFAPLAATEAATPTVTVATPASLRAEAVTVTAATATPAAAAPHDFTTLVDRLVEAREAAQPNVIRTALAHAEFGTVSLQFRQDQTHMNVTVAGADPGLATAVQAAAAASLAAGAGNDDGAAPRQDNAQSQQNQQQAASTTSQGQQQSQTRSEAAQRGGQREQAGQGRKTAEDTSGKSPAAPSTRRSGIFA